MKMRILHDLCDVKDRYIAMTLDLINNGLPFWLIYDTSNGEVYPYGYQPECIINGEEFKADDRFNTNFSPFTNMNNIGYVYKDPKFLVYAMESCGIRYSTKWLREEAERCYIESNL